MYRRYFKQNVIKRKTTIPAQVSQEIVYTSYCFILSKRIINFKYGTKVSIECHTVLLSHCLDDFSYDNLQHLSFIAYYVRWFSILTGCDAVLYYAEFNNIIQKWFLNEFHNPISGARVCSRRMRNGWKCFTNEIAMSFYLQSK